MLFTITGKHIEVTDALRAHAQSKCEKLPRYYDSISQIDVIIDGKDGGKPGVEIIAHAEHCNDFVVKESGEDMYACIDVAIHKLERQLRKKKEKQRNNKHVGGPELETGLTEAEM
ncbi:MAG TPA: ribosome-associated translation inhibitor RaiA [Anaerohalosphaeraceae bacterium]|jgi:putative sigma-54 modulation protein|nr:ribosome-associated translation inhibitor RaiA [Anaerohalosphaeraceae bacterium]HRT50866.1 ribosome-associated translation inhibitor RaiA [Anaerohalosphaeraceae bacterium]HRT86696.1 ribosome-associated translation inhibitor RaiA [Anaerohalosphaeraceae bacterium]